MGQLRLRGDDDLTVLASLSIAFGMVVGALAALWIMSGEGAAIWGRP